MAHNAEDISRRFSSLQIGYIADVTEPMDADSNVDWVLEHVSGNPDVEVIPIERNGIVQGVLSKALLKKMSGSAWAKFWQKDLDSYTIPIRGIIDATSYVNRVLEEILNQESYETAWYVVQFRRSYMGIVSARKILEHTNAMRNHDLHLTRDIQQYLLKKSLITDKRFDLCLFNRMAHEVGGDFYCVYRLDKDRILVGCFDVAGKNVSAALTTVALGTCFTSFELFQYMDSPDKMTNRINALVKSINPSGVFVAALFVYIDFTIRKIHIHNCGFSPVILFVPQKDNKIGYRISNPTLPPLGIEEEYDFSDSQIIPISKGLRICAYSDGLTDIMNIYGERYGEEQAFKLLKKLHSVPRNDIEKIIIRETNNWMGTASQADDVTLMDIRFLEN